MDRELRNEAKKVLEALATPEHRRDGERIYKNLTLNTRTPNLEREAVIYLCSKGCLVKSGQSSYVITAVGRDYLDELSTWGPWYWFQNNWFPATVALATILVGSSAAVVQIWTVLARSC